MFPNGNTAIDGRVMASAFTDFRDNIIKAAHFGRNRDAGGNVCPRGAVVRNKPNRLRIRFQAR